MFSVKLQTRDCVPTNRIVLCSINILLNIFKFFFSESLEYRIKHYTKKGKLKPEHKDE